MRWVLLGSVNRYITRFWMPLTVFFFSFFVWGTRVVYIIHVYVTCLFGFCFLVGTVLFFVYLGTP